MTEEKIWYGYRIEGRNNSLIHVLREQWLGPVPKNMEINLALDFKIEKGFEMKIDDTVKCVYIGSFRGDVSHLIREGTDDQVMENKKLKNHYKYNNYEIA